MTEFLGRAKSARRSESDNERGYRNGYGRPRRLTLSSGTVQLRRPRVRNTEEEFESWLLPLFVNRTRKVAELIPQLYLHGLSKVTSTWRCGDCWEKRHRYRRAR